jgi:hypothetical protein
MSKIALSGDASGTGTFTIASPNSNSNYTLTLPTESGTVLTGSTTTGFKNRLINGEMDIDQRNAGASVTLGVGGGNGYPADRWYVENFTDGTATVQQVADAPAGFSNSIRYTVTATDTSLASDQSVFIQQRVEGFNSADLSFGTASAKSVTLSFWVKSSVTGTFGGALANSAYNRGYPFTYTISSANTWEQKSVTIPGDTTGTWVGATNGVGLRLTFALAAGSARVSTAGAWAAYVGIGATGGTNLMATNSATWQVTGCQLELGSQATSFDFRDYGTEFMRCQRYFRLLRDPVANGVITGSGTQISRLSFFSPVQMRATPTISSSGTFGFWNGATTATATTQVGSFPTVYGDFQVDYSGLSVNLGADGRAGAMYTATGTTPTISVSAEL